MKKLLALLGLSFGAMLASNAYAVDFHSPTGNISCSGYNGGVDCVIWESNYGYRYCNSGSVMFSISTYSGTRITCPYSIGSGRVLPYGQSLRGNGWTCSSAKTGITCRNYNGNGFLVRRANFRIF